MQNRFLKKIFFGIFFFLSNHIQTTHVLVNEYSQTLELIRAVYDKQYQEKFGFITTQIGSNLASFAKLIGADPTITSFDGFPIDLQSMSAFNFNFWMKSGNYYDYSFISPSYGTSPTSGEVQTALDGTIFADFNWSTVLKAIQNDGAYMALLAFDKNNKFISSLKGSDVKLIALVVYDSLGNLLSGMPLIFSAQNYTMNTIGKTGPLNFSDKIDVNNPVKFAVYNASTVVASSNITNYPFLIGINIGLYRPIARVLDLIRAVYKKSIDGTIPPSSSPLTVFYLWAPSKDGQPVVDIDFTNDNKKLLNILNSALLSQDVYLNFLITPPTESLGASVTMQGYDSAGNPISGLTYQAIQGTTKETLAYGYFRYSYTPNPQASDLIGLPVGNDFTALQLSNLWIKVTQQSQQQQPWQQGGQAIPSQSIANNYNKTHRGPAW